MRRDRHWRQLCALEPAAEVIVSQRYRLLDRLGRGGMGEVFRAHDRLTGQLIALKRARPTPRPRAAACAKPLSQSAAARHTLPADTMLPLITAGPASRQQTPAPLPKSQSAATGLTQEFHLLNSLQHPYIVRAFDHGFDEKQPFFTMELVDKASHLDLAARQLPLPMRVSLLLQILQALAHLHLHNVIHRDLKPSNILVQSGRCGPHVKLLDFGLAVRTSEASRTNGSPAGSIGYIAPELLGGAPANAAADLFSVGVIAHELLLGSHPLAACSMFERLRGFSGSAPIFLHDERLGSALSAVLRCALCREPLRRYGDAAAFSYELATAAGLSLPLNPVQN